MSCPIVVDIDGTMSREDRSIEGRVIDALRSWSSTVVVATGKAVPYPVALCDFIGIERRVIAENGGIVIVDDTIETHDNVDALTHLAADLRDAGFDLGWGPADFINRWRETELATTRTIPRNRLEELAGRHGLEVVDSGFAYHVKSPRVSKGNGVLTVSELLDIPPEDFVAIGDSENDISTFDVVGVSYAVQNAHDDLKRAADHVTVGSYADGLLEALNNLD